MTASDATPDGVGGVDRVDRVVEGPVPKHAQLREILRRVIERKLPPGSRIPSERELAGRYRVSRVTVRAAVGRLADEGLLTRVRGKGTFTAARRKSPTTTASASRTPGKPSEPNRPTATPRGCSVSGPVTRSWSSTGSRAITADRWKT